MIDSMMERQEWMDEYLQECATLEKIDINDLDDIAIAASSIHGWWMTCLEHVVT